MRRVRVAVVLLVGAVLVLACGSAAAVPVSDLKGFESLFGRYGPHGNCAKYPQVLVTVGGFALDRGQGRVERGGPIEYAASFFGPEYNGIAQAFFPFWRDGGPNPFIVLINDGEKPGTLSIAPHDLGWKGGPPMPARYQPWLAGSPYARCAKS